MRERKDGVVNREPEGIEKHTMRPMNLHRSVLHQLQVQRRALLATTWYNSQISQYSQVLKQCLKFETLNPPVTELEPKKKA